MNYCGSVKREREDINCCRAKANTLFVYMFTVKLQLISIIDDDVEAAQQSE